MGSRFQRDFGETSFLSDSEKRFKDMQVVCSVSVEMGQTVHLGTAG